MDTVIFFNANITFSLSLSLTPTHTHAHTRAHTHTHPIRSIFYTDFPLLLLKPNPHDGFWALPWPGPSLSPQALYTSFPFPPGLIALHLALVAGITDARIPLFVASVIHVSPESPSTGTSASVCKRLLGAQWALNMYLYNEWTNERRHEWVTGPPSSRWHENPTDLKGIL